MKIRKKYFLTLVLNVLLTFTLTAQPLTKLEKSNFTQLTSHSQMMKYLKALVSNSNKIQMRIIGRSVNGLEIPALFLSNSSGFGSEKSKKPIVLVYAQQHGNEPAGKEAVLIEARNLLSKDNYLLNKMDVILVPQVNPDGAEAGKRRNANKMDLNRNHVILSEPESFALHSLFLEWMPMVTLDMHETNIIKKDWVKHFTLKDAEEMFGTVSNPNISKQISEFAHNKMLKEIGGEIVKEGFRFSEYIVGSPFNGKRIRFSTTNINDGRQSMGIYNTLSFIVECTKYNDLLTDIRRRTYGHVSAIRALLKTVYQNRDSIISIVTKQRVKIITGNLPKRIALKADYFPDSSRKQLTYPVFNLLKWKHETRKLNNFQPLVKIKKTVERPYAYVFSKKLKRLIKLLKKHNIIFHKLKQNSAVLVEAYKILHKTPSVEEDKKIELLDVNTQRISKQFAAGDIVITLSQKAGLLIPLLLEPESSFGIVTERSGRKYRFKNFVKVGNEYPIYRILNKKEIENKIF